MSEPPVLLVTGFGPFGGHAHNPSADVVGALAASGYRSAHLVTEVLPVSFARATGRIRALIAQHSPDAVLALGLADNRRTLTIERVALNVADARTPDNDGARPVDEPIAPAGPDAYLATLPVRQMRDAIRDDGIDAHLSASAGLYVCNAVMYCALDELAARGPGHATGRAGFVHLPPADAVSVADDVHAVHAALGAILAHAKEAPC